MHKILFVCSANKDRSKTAEDHFSEQFPELEFMSAGTNQRICEQEGTNHLSEDLLDWADHIFVMEEKHRQWIKANSKLKLTNKIEVLTIPDIFTYDQKELINILTVKIEPILQKIQNAQ